MIKLTEDCQAPRILSLGRNTQDVGLCCSSACRGRGALRALFFWKQKSPYPQRHLVAKRRTPS